MNHKNCECDLCIGYLGVFFKKVKNVFDKVIGKK